MNMSRLTFYFSQNTSRILHTYPHTCETRVSEFVEVCTVPPVQTPLSGTRKARTSGTVQYGLLARKEISIGLKVQTVYERLDSLQRFDCRTWRRFAIE